LRCSPLLTSIVLALAALASYLIWAFPAPFGGEAVRQLKVIGVVTIFLVVVVAYFLTCFISAFIGAEAAGEAY
jgi:hypothetical protein